MDTEVLGLGLPWVAVIVLVIALVILAFVNSYWAFNMVMCLVVTAVFAAIGYALGYGGGYLLSEMDSPLNTAEDSRALGSSFGYMGAGVLGFFSFVLYWGAVDDFG